MVTVLLPQQRGYFEYICIHMCMHVGVCCVTHRPHRVRMISAIHVSLMWFVFFSFLVLIQCLWILLAHSLSLWLSFVFAYFRLCRQLMYVQSFYFLYRSCSIVLYLYFRANFNDNHDTLHILYILIVRVCEYK